MIIDIHVHILEPWNQPKHARRLLDLADRFGIDKMCIFLGKDLKRYKNAREVRETNDLALDMMRRYPDRFIGFCFLNPRAGKKCLEELNRCIEAGMRGIKLWTECACDNPLVFPIVERAIKFNVPILQHTWKITGGQDADHSDPDQFVRLARRYPEARLVLGHTGGNWAYGLRAVRHLPNVWTDTAGGNAFDGLVELACREVGPHRVLFGSDVPVRSFASAMAKVDGAEISASTRRMILGENARRLLGL